MSAVGKILYDVSGVFAGRSCLAAEMSESEPVTITYEPQSTPSPARSRVTFSPEYLKTIPGILKIVEIVSI